MIAIPNQENKGTERYINYLTHNALVDWFSKVQTKI